MQDKKLTPEEIKKIIKKRKEDQQILEEKREEISKDFQEILNYCKNRCKCGKDVIEIFNSALHMAKSEQFMKCKDSTIEADDEQTYYYLGDTIKLSQVSNVKVKNFKFKILVIVARIELIIDHDLSANNIFLVSPTWTIQNHPILNLSGRNGESVDNELLPFSKNGAGFIRNGQDGEDGGNFHGFGFQFFNLQHLKVISNGGNGGNGQGTEDAINIKDRHFDLKKMFSENKEVPCKQSPYRELNVIRLLFLDNEGVYGNQMELKINKEHIMSSYNNVYMTVKLLPLSGYKAHEPGYGGQSGKQGIIYLQNFNTDKMETGFQMEQKDGNPGKKGKKGKDGRNANGEMIENFKIYYDKDKWVCRIDKDQNPQPQQIKY